MIKSFVFILALIAITQSRCLDGCLRCSPNNQCLFCDVLKGFALEEGRCVRKQIPNCILLNERSQCLKCEENYYVDQISRSCLKLPEQVKVENCVSHISPGVCGQCSEKFALKKGGCVELTSPIENCDVQNLRNECLTCKKGFMRSLDLKTCLEKPEDSNCVTFAHVKCRQCSSGYLMNENYYLKQMFGFQNTQQFQRLTNQLYTIRDEVIDSIKFKTCQKQRVEFCNVYETFDRCKRCQSGYFVNKKFKCEKIPDPIIANCRRYSSLSSCVDCAQGYRLNTSTECLPINPIDNCLLYKTDTPLSTCTRCYEDYYLSAENLCKMRTDLSKIDFCQELSHDFEKCKKCQSDYEPTSDRQRCLPKIKNCLKYTPSNQTNFHHECEFCDKGYFYNNSDRVCIKGTIRDCEVYLVQENKCAICLPSHHLVDFRCLPHQIQKDCNEYSPNKIDLCTKCSVHNFLFIREKSCVKVDRIDNCQKYATKTTCEECRLGYQLINPSQCVLIPPEEFCLKKNSQNKCIQCRDNYLSVMGIECIPNFSFGIEGCSQSMNGFCQVCKENFVPMNTKNSFVCLKNQSLTARFDIDPDCLQYQSNSSSIFDCVRCKKGMVIDNNRCRSNCTDINKATLYRQLITLHNEDNDDLKDSFMIERWNVCHDTIPNCEIAAMNVFQDYKIIRYSCEKCVSEYIPVISIDDDSDVIVKYNPDFKKVDINSPLSFVPGVKCVKVETDQEQLLGEVDKSRSQIPNCEYYYQLLKDRQGCFKCRFGFTGKVVSLVKNCKIYKEINECLECEQKFFMASKMECKPIEEINHCIVYDPWATESQCKECEQDFFVGVNKKVCTKRINTLKVPFCIVEKEEDDCKCSVGFQINKTAVPFVCQKIPETCTEFVMNQLVIECTKCKRDKSYLEANECKLGTIQHCDQYNLTQNLCESCLNDYYPNEDNKKCLPHNTDNTNCEEFSDVAHTCSKCNKQSILFEIKNKCRQVLNQSLNCKKWKNPYMCEECEDNFYLNKISRKCETIPASMNCLKMKVVDIDGQEGIDYSDYVVNHSYVHTCEQCKPSFYKVQKTKTFLKLIDGNNVTVNYHVCLGYLEVMRTDCQQSTVNGKVGFINGCQSCKELHLPLSINKMQVCLERKYVQHINQANTIDNNCKRYKYDQGYKCQECNYPFFLDNDVCVENCSGGKNKVVWHLVSGIEILKNVCVQLDNNQLITNCEEYADTYDNKFSHDLSATYDEIELILGCVKCTSGSAQYMNQLSGLVPGQAQYRYTFIDINNPNNNLYQFSNQRYLTKLCIPKEPILGYKNISGYIEHCEFYSNISDKLGCQKCKWGYTGRVRNYQWTVTAITTIIGYIEYCEPITDCNTSIVLGGLSEATVFQSSNGPLSFYFNCHVCNNNKYLVSFVNGTNQDGIPVLIDGFRAFQHNIDKSNTRMNEVTDASLYSRQTMCMSESDFVNDVDTAVVRSPDPVLPPDQIQTASDATFLIQNCGAFLVNVNAKGLTNYICAACKPKYAPTFENDGSISACAMIQIESNDCLSSNSFNKCDDCVLSYDNTFNNILNTCMDYSQTTTNCLSGVLFQTNLQCKICVPGYELFGGSCEKIYNQPQCTEFNSEGNAKNLLTFKKQFLSGNYFYLQNQKDLGCLQCDNPGLVPSFTNGDLNLDQYLCHEVPFQLVFNADKLNNCKYHWKNENGYECKQCDDTFIMVKGVCEPGVPTLPNCAEAEDYYDTICQRCNPDTNLVKYLNITGECRDIIDQDHPEDHPAYAVANCAVYDRDLTAIKHKAICEKCKTGYYLQPEENDLFFTCNLIDVSFNCDLYHHQDGCTKCKKGYGLVKFKDKGISKVECMKMDNQSQDYVYDTNCEELIEAYDQDGSVFKKLTCKKCKPNFLVSPLKLSDTQNFCYEVRDIKTNCTEYDIQNPFSNSTQRCLKCQAPTLFYLNKVTNTCFQRQNLSPFCKEFQANQDKCKLCKIGYQLSFDETDCLQISSTGQPGYIHACQKMNQCDTKTRYEGLSKDLNILFSCHKCKQPDEIPVANVTLNKTPKVKGFQKIGQLTFFDYFDDHLYQNSDGNSSAVQCLKMESTSFRIAQNLFNFPTNCGLALVKINGLKDASDSNKVSNINEGKIVIRCVACKPGYMGISANVIYQGKVQKLGLFYGQCQEILNCEYSYWFNACSQCKPNYAYTYDKKEGINYGVCSLYEENPDCVAFYQVNSKKKCVYCKKGTFLNRDGYCEIINTSNCENGQFRFKQTFMGHNASRGIFTSDNMVGCSQCKPGFVGYLFYGLDICVHSLYHSQNKVPANTFYIQNCKNYQNNIFGQLTCDKCKEGFVKSRKGKCYSQTNLANCEIASGLSLCDQCKEGYVHVNRKCEKPTITDCLEFGNEELFENGSLDMIAPQKQICVKCKPESYLASGICQKGAVPFCQQMETKNICNECLEGFTLVQMKEGKSYCYPNDQRYNCKEFDSLKLQSSVLSCIRCKNENYILSESKSDFFEKSCMGFNYVKYCRKYDNNPIAIADSSFKCLQCDDSHYLEDGICKSRISKPEECVYFDQLADRCLKCQEGYYIDGSGNSCSPFPQGLNGCRIYKTKTICEACEAKMYLKEGICHNVLVELPNCIYYHDKHFCAQCEVGFINVKGTCRQTQAKDCLTYNGLKACETCPTGFGLKLEGDLLNCVQQNITNCLDFEQVEPYKCNVCEKDFFVKDGVCSAVTNKIDNCLQYSGADSCVICSKGTALAKDKKSCLQTPEVVINMDQNCEDSIIPEQPFCNTCEPGYTFSYGQCIACSEQLIENGCYNCHPDFPDICLMCASGWIHTPEGECTKPVIESSGLEI